MSDVLLRHWTMLRLVPRHPRKIDPPTLQRRLADEGYDVDLRSVQRDLHKLSRAFPLVTDEGRPAGWSWDKSAPALDVPGLEPHAAIAFRLIEQQLSHQLPRATLDALRPHFQHARAVLGGLAQDGLPAWSDKVRVVPRGQALLAPKVAPAVLAAVHDALLQGRKLVVRYTNRAGKTSDGEVNPLGLVYRDALPVLICTWFDLDDDVRQLPLPRIARAELSPSKRRAPKGFDLGAYLASGAVSFRLGDKPIRLVARFHKEAAPSVLETPLSDEQTARVDDDDWVRVEARVIDTRVLRGFLLSFGDKVEVLAPASLRAAVAEQLQRAHARYGASAG